MRKSFYQTRIISNCKSREGNPLEVSPGRNIPTLSMNRLLLRPLKHKTSLVSITILCNLAERIYSIILTNENADSIAVENPEGVRRPNLPPALGTEYNTSDDLSSDNSQYSLERKVGKAVSPFRRRATIPLLSRISFCWNYTRKNTKGQFVKR